MIWAGPVEGDIFRIEFEPEGNWVRSSFPDPLVTVDYDAEDNVIAITAAGSKAAQLNERALALLQPLATELRAQA